MIATVADVKKYRNISGTSPIVKDKHGYLVVKHDNREFQIEYSTQYHIANLPPTARRKALRSKVRFNLFVADRITCMEIQARLIA